MRYWLTQGDTCGITSVPYDSSGQVVDSDLISFVKFKLYRPDKSKECFFEKIMEYDGAAYVLHLSTIETSAIPVGKYRYEIEYTFENNDVNTPNQSDFEITEQAL